MALLKPAVNQTAYLKLGTLGFQGSGKTYLAVHFAIGLAKLSKSKTKKVAFLDTEKGSDFHIERFKKAGIQLDIHKSRSFEDAVSIISEAEAGAYDFLIVDSVTHLWRELCDSYLKAKIERIKSYQNTQKKIVVGLNMKDWVFLKAEWARFTDAFVNSKVHIAACGRAGFEYDISEDEEGKQEIVKAGTKMKAEGEFGYESDLLLEVYKVPLAEIKRNKKEKGHVHRCLVLKDRTDTINARVFDMPKFKDFKTVIDFLNIGGEHVGVDQTRASDTFYEDGEKTLAYRNRLREIAIENLQETMILNGLDGKSDATKKVRTELLIKAFGQSSKTFIENLPHDKIAAGINEIRFILKAESDEKAGIVNPIAVAEKAFKEENF